MSHKAVRFIAALQQSMALADWHNKKLVNVAFLKASHFRWPKSTKTVVTSAFYGANASSKKPRSFIIPLRPSNGDSCTKRTTGYDNLKYILLINITEYTVER